ncbi:F-box only protein 36, partial [Galemys pyrenaicus]
SYRWLLVLTSALIQSQVIFRWWKISLRSEYRSTKPGEIKGSLEDFLENANIQVQVALIFGGRILDYVSNLCKGQIDYLERLSDTLLLYIISHLDLEDIARLSQTSRRFAKLCMSDVLWEQIVQLACDNITSDMRALATDIGWRRMFFTNKLQLQRQLRRRKQSRKLDVQSSEGKASLSAAEITPSFLAPQDADEECKATLLKIGNRSGLYKLWPRPNLTYFVATFIANTTLTNGIGKGGYQGIYSEQRCAGLSSAILEKRERGRGDASSITDIVTSGEYVVLRTFQHRFSPDKAAFGEAVTAAFMSGDPSYLHVPWAPHSSRV